MSKKVIIFDFDGVIVCSMQVSYSINKKTVPNLEYSEWCGWYEGNVYKTIRKEFSSQAYQDNFFKEYGTAILDLPPVKGISEVIIQLANYYTLAIISSSSQPEIEAYLGKYSLRSYFEDILARETHKNKIDKLHLILHKYKAKTDDALIITDTTGDIKEAEEVGIKSIGVTWGVHDARKLKEANVSFIVTNPQKLVGGVRLILGC